MLVICVKRSSSGNATGCEPVRGSQLQVPGLSGYLPTHLIRYRWYSQVDLLSLISVTLLSRWWGVDTPYKQATCQRHQHTPNLSSCLTTLPPFPASLAPYLPSSLTDRQRIRRYRVWVCRQTVQEYLALACILLVDWAPLTY